MARCVGTYSLDATFAEITLVVLSVSAEPTVAIVVHVALTAEVAVNDGRRQSCVYNGAYGRTGSAIYG